MLTQAIQKLKVHALEALLAGLGTALSAGLVLAENHLAQYVSQATPTTVIRAAALLLLVSLWSFSALLLFRPRLKFDTRLGIYRDRKTGLHYCPSCHSKKIRAPLKEGDRRWYCQIRDCRMSFPKPDAL